MSDYLLVQTELIWNRRIYEGDAERIAQEAARQENEQPDSLVAEALSEVMQDLEAP